MSILCDLVIKKFSAFFGSFLPQKKKKKKLLETRKITFIKYQLVPILYIFTESIPNYRNWTTLISEKNYWHKVCKIK